MNLQLGYTQTRPELHVYLDGLAQSNVGEPNIAAQALNEDFTDRGLDHPVAYAEEF